MSPNPLLLILLAACSSGKSASNPQSTELEPSDGGADGADGGGPDDTGPDDTGPDDTGPDDTGVEPSPFDALREAIQNDLDHSRASGASVAIYSHGELIFAEGFGSAHPDHEQAVTTDTLFAIGSDTKKIAAIAALQQVALGRLDLDAPLTTTLPTLGLSQTPEWTAGVTLHELLSHQGGLWDFTPWYDAPEDSELSAIAYGDFAANIGAIAPGGAMWNYSNPNFSIAGLTTEDADGRAWADIVEQDIFGPLGMTRSFARQAEVEEDGDYATGTGYTFTESWDSLDPWQGWSTEAEDYTFGVVEMADSADNAFTRPAGMVWSTATDMARLGDFLLRGDPAVLSDLDRERITSSQVVVYPSFGEELASYGYGVFISAHLSIGADQYAIPVWSHGGNTLSQTSTFYILPEQELVISILSNGYADDMGESVVTAITTLVELPEPMVAEPLPTELDPLDSYAGVYYDPVTLGEITVSVDGEDLRVEVPALTEHSISYNRTLEPIGTDYFIMSISSAGYDLTFLDGEDGTPNQYLRNRLFVGTRMGEAERHARPAASTRALSTTLPAEESAPFPLLNPLPKLMRPELTGRP